MFVLSKAGIVFWSLWIAEEVQAAIGRDTGAVAAFESRFILQSHDVRQIRQQLCGDATGSTDESFEKALVLGEKVGKNWWISSHRLVGDLVFYFSLFRTLEKVCQANLD